MQRGGGDFNRGRGRGRGRGGASGAGGGFRGGRGGGRGGMQRVEMVNGIPVPPPTPLDDPFVLPFPRLMAKNSNATMTLDEELLRAIIGQFTVIATSCLDFNDLFTKLKEQHPHLIAAIYDSPPHLWSYIRCYPEQFGVDQDPRFPWQITYLSRCKIVAKADRNRYRREFADGNIRAVADVEKSMDAVSYNVEMEKRSVTYLFAIFEQYGRIINATARHLEMKKIATVFRPHSDVPRDICTYVGEVDAFVLKRSYFFNTFGDQVNLCAPNYAKTIRKLTLLLKERGQGGYFELGKFYDNFRDPGLFDNDDFKVISHDGMFTYQDFLLFLQQHRLVFRLFTRDNRIKLRHDVVPEIDWAEVEAVPPYKTLRDVFFTNASDPNAMPAEQETTEQAQGADMHDPEAVSTDGEDYNDEYNDSFDGLPPQMPTRNSAQSGADLTLATPVSTISTFSNNEALESLRLATAESHANQNVIAARPGIMQDDMQGLAVFENPERPAQPRFMLRVGARPPRASVRCRPPAPHRHSDPQELNVRTGSLNVRPLTSQPRASEYGHLEEELEF